MTRLNPGINDPLPPGVEDPNPVMLFHVYSGILMAISGIVYRSITASLLPNPAESDDQEMHSLVSHLSFVSDLLQDHAMLISTAGAAAQNMLPLGAHTLWLSPLQMERYTTIRDGVINATTAIIQECASLNNVTIAPALIPLIEKDLKVIQASIRGVFSMNTFGEAAEILRTGFSSALYVFDLILHEDDRNSPPMEAL